MISLRLPGSPFHQSVQWIHFPAYAAPLGYTEELGLKAGDSATVLVKATEVMLAVDKLWR